MYNFLTAVSTRAVLALSVTVGSPIAVMAQATPTDTPAPAATPDAAADTPAPQAPSADADAPAQGGAAGIEDQLSLGEDANAAPAPNQPYTKETNGDWDLRCIRTQDGEDPCQMYQLMDDGEGVPVAEFSLFRLPSGGKAQAGATVVVPLETALQSQLTIQIDGGAARKYPYSFCNPIGCYARIGLTSADVAAFKAGGAAKLTIVPALAPDQKVELGLSLSGFTASYDKSSVIQQ